MRLKRFGGQGLTSILVFCWLAACSSGTGSGPTGGAKGTGGSASGGATAGGTGGGMVAATGGSAGAQTGGTQAASGGKTASGTGGTGEGGRVATGGTTVRADAAAGGSGGGSGGQSATGGSGVAVDAATTATGGTKTGGTSPADAAVGTGGNRTPDAAPDAAKPAVDTATSSTPRKLLLCDEGNKRILLLDLQNPATPVWSKDFATQSPRDLQLIGGNRVAASSTQGYLELDLDTGAVKKEVKGFTGVESIRRLPGGNTLLAGNSDGGVTLQELDTQDKLVTGRKVTFTNFTNLRIVRRTPTGTFLIGVGDKLAEVNWQKQTVWEMAIPAGNYVYQGVHLSDGRIAVTSGYGATVVLLDPATKKVLATLGGKTQADATTIVPNFYGGFQVMANGQFLVTNWQGHGAGNGGKGVQLLQYDSTGKVTWKWNQDAKLVSSLHHVIALDGLDTGVLHDDVNGELAPVVP